MLRQIDWNKVWEDVALPSTIEGAEADSLKQLIEPFWPKSGQKIKLFEFGCAPGTFLSFFAKNFNADVYGCDTSETGLRATKENFKSLGLPVPFLVQISAENILGKFPAASFDVVCSFGFVEHFKNLDDIIKLHAVLLKPQGLLLISVPNLNPFYAGIGTLLAPRNLWLSHRIRSCQLGNISKAVSKVSNMQFSGGTGDFFDSYITRESKTCRRIVNRLKKNKRCFSYINRHPNFFLPSLFTISRKDF